MPQFCHYPTMWSSVPDYSTREGPWGILVPCPGRARSANIPVVKDGGILMQGRTSASAEGMTSCLSSVELADRNGDENRSRAWRLPGVIGSNFVDNKYAPMLNSLQLASVRFQRGWALSSATLEAINPAPSAGALVRVVSTYFGADPGNGPAIENDSHREILTPQPSGH